MSFLPTEKDGAVALHQMPWLKHLGLIEPWKRRSTLTVGGRQLSSTLFDFTFT
jgi:hypothetical protein